MPFIVLIIGFGMRDILFMSFCSVTLSITAECTLQHMESECLLIDQTVPYIGNLKCLVFLPYQPPQFFVVVILFYLYSLFVRELRKENCCLVFVKAHYFEQMNALIYSPTKSMWKV